METIIEQPEAKPKPLTKRKKIIHISFLAASIVITILFAIYLTGKLEYLTETYESYGLAGVFLMGLIGSSAPIWLVPGSVAAFFAGGLGWNPFYIALAAGVGEGIGELIGYTAGFGSQIAVEKIGFYPKIKSWMKRRGWLVIFLASAIPNHFVKLVGGAAGALRYPAWKYFIIGCTGKIIKSLCFALAGRGLFNTIKPFINGGNALWIILVAGVGIAVVVGTLVYFFYYRKHRNRKQEPPDNL
ncbi:MAG: VTT domain-containing protein [Chloroflexi bacterium]|jgi:uncharacterized membrane protein YdjX (TVP38/TMEM64 family)|nr:VTT domain-containing protein [Chloroflexota bacterium]MBT7081154.1 VTT domain-containing protein [Chloroflexota bacterium]MBT7290745.1 VTT domain-containing protein [Chloroflexota bacterium]